MTNRKIQIPAGMECGICGEEFWTRAVGHWFACEGCRLTAERYIREDEEDSRADGHDTHHYNSVEG